MRIKLANLGWTSALVASLGLTITGTAQDRTYPRLTGTTATKMEAPARASEDSAERQIEIRVELALLGDPITFPYYLEARMAGSKLEIRGFVPNRTVKEHAMKLARLHSAMNVIDAMRENPSLTVRPTRLPPEKLHASANLALEQGLPATHRSMHLEVTSEGRVTIKGTVASLEEKLAASQALRRLHGCSYVVNMTRVDAAAAGLDWHASASPDAKITKTGAKATAPKGGKAPGLTGVETAQFSAPDKRTPAAAPKEDEPNRPFGGFFARMFGKDKKPAEPKTPLPPPTYGTKPAGKAPAPIKISTVGEPGKLPAGGAALPLPKGPALPPISTVDKKTPATAPYEAPGVIVLPAPDPATVKKGGKALSLTQIKSKLEKAFPGIGPIQVVSEGGQKIRVEVAARSNEESNQLAGRILSLPDLEPYEVNLHIRIDEPKSSGK